MAKKTEGARDSRWRALPLIHAACSRLPPRIFASIRRSDSLSRPSPSGKPSGEEEQQRVDKVTITRHARTHRSSSGRGWPAGTTPPACFLVTCGLVLHFHSANCLFIGSPRQPRSFHGVKPPSLSFLPPPPVSPRFVAWRRGGDLVGNELRIALDPRGIRAEFRGSTQIGSSPFGPLWVLEAPFAATAMVWFTSGKRFPLSYSIAQCQWSLGLFKSSSFEIRKR